MKSLNAMKMKSRFVEVDIDSVCSINHNCTGCGKDSQFCCASYEVCLSEAEVDRAMVWMPEAAKYSRYLKSDDGYANVFDELDDSLFSMETIHSGRCVFAYVKKGNLWCSLHTVALDRNIPLQEIKPLSCLLWPLSISEGKNKSISAQDNALDFHCNRRRQKKPPSLNPSVVDILDTVFGEPFRKEVEKGVRKGEKKVRLKLPRGVDFS